MATPQWIREMLQRRGVAYQERHHREAYTAQEVAQQEHISGHRVAKVVVVMADGRPVELVLPASRKVMLDQVKGLLGATEVRMASETEMQYVFPDCEVGAVPPLTPDDKIRVLMDETMEVPGDILFQAGTHSDAIRVGFKEWFDLAHPQVGAFTRPAEAPPADSFMSREF